MDPFTMVIAIVAIVTVGSIIRAKQGGTRRDKRDSRHALRDETVEAENRQLREEMRGMKERLAVLERLATDNNTSLDREIEKLRDRNSDRV